MATEKEVIPERFAKLATKAFDPEIVRCTNAIKLLADFDIPDERSSCFRRFHAFITEPQPKYITAWRADKTDEHRFYRRHVDGVLYDVRNALAAAHYHKANLDEIQGRVAEALRTSKFAERLGDVVVVPGSTRKMDFEYQGFILAVRRCLDYLARALLCYFKREANSFRTLPQSIAKTKCPKVAEAITKAHSRHVSNLAFVLLEGRRSVRNRIAHYEFVSAGCINLTPRGFILAGGREELSGFGRAGNAPLQEALTNHLDCIHRCVDDMIDSFITVAREIENS